MFAAFVSLLSPFPVGSEVVKFTVDGAERTAIVIKPSSPSRQKAAAYFVFHGLGGNAQFSVKQFHIQDLDPTAYVIYAQGIPAPSGGRLGGRRGGVNTWQIMPNQYGDRDIHFVQALVKWANSNSIDREQRYFVGHSNGSCFAWVVLKTMGEQFTRFVGMNGATLLPMSGAPKKSVFMTTGTSDRIVSPASVQRFADTLAQYDGCSTGSGSPIKTYAGKAPVYLYQYDGGHMPPTDAYEMAVKFCQTGRPI